MELLQHVAIIMDGNGRWAQKRNRPRIYGHIKGARVARKIVTEAAKLKLKTLTLFAFSTENWKRPVTEVSFLMQLLERYLKKERATLVRENIRFHCLGEMNHLPSHVVQGIKTTIELTKHNTGLNLVFALNYGGRQDITAAARILAEKAVHGEISPNDITEELFATYLSSHPLPDPDLVIRTSGEFRVSNFLLWQSAYSEFYISPILWPDFTEADFRAALDLYSSRQRRYGGLAAPTAALEG